MKKLNQKSINKIIFLKLFENTNEIFQDSGIDSSKVNVSSMNGMNAPPQRVLPTKLQVRQNPIKPINPYDIERTPEEEWDNYFSRDNFYEMWKVYWEEMYGKNYTNQEQMNADFETLVRLMHSKFIKLITPRTGYDGLNIPGMDQGDAFDEVIRLFLRATTHPTMA